MNETLQAIADICIKNNPDRAHVYTLAWVQNKCASLNVSPEAYLAELQSIEARAEAAEPVSQDAAWTKDLPPHYVEKLSGAIDGFSHGLMKEGGAEG